jgi:hypothetical protein
MEELLKGRCRLLCPSVTSALHLIFGPRTDGELRPSIRQAPNAFFDRKR